MLLRAVINVAADAMPAFTGGFARIARRSCIVRIVGRHSTGAVVIEDLAAALSKAMTHYLVSSIAHLNFAV